MLISLPILVRVIAGSGERISGLFPSRHDIRHGAPPNCTMKQRLLGRRHVGFLSMPNLQSRLLDGPGKRKRQRPRQSRFEPDIHGIQAGRGQLAGLAAR